MREEIKELCDNRGMINGVYSDIGILGIVGFVLICCGNIFRLLQIVCGEAGGSGGPSMETQLVLCGWIGYCLYPSLLMAFGIVYATIHNSLVSASDKAWDDATIEEQESIDQWLLFLGFMIGTQFLFAFCTCGSSIFALFTRNAAAFILTAVVLFCSCTIQLVFMILIGVGVQDDDDSWALMAFGIHTTVTNTVIAQSILFPFMLLC